MLGFCANVAVILDFKLTADGLGLFNIVAGVEISAAESVPALIGHSVIGGGDGAPHTIRNLDERCAA